ncbi:MAG: septum formation initiator family protein [Gemmatimonadaceae bacterium]
MARSRKGSGGLLRAAVKAALLVGALMFAIEGGEYGTSDLVRQRTRERVLRAEIDSLSRVVDSLGQYKRRVETDPKLQERIAREEFGLVRGSKELLYRFADPDTVQRAGERTRP